MFRIGRREVLLGGAATLALGACGQANSNTATTPDDMVLGAADAPVTLIEYASATCPHCREWHEHVWDELKANYIDTGKVRFVFREFPTPPPAVAVGAFQVARCGGASPEQYFTRLGVVFEQQQAMFATGTMEGVRQKLIEIGRSSGLSEQEVMGCLADEAGPARIRRIVEAGQSEFQVSATPTLILNGRKLSTAEVSTYDGMAREIDAALNAGD